MTDLNVPAGWRVRGNDEVVEEGDCYWKNGNVWPPSDTCCVNVGKTVWETRDWFSDDQDRNVITQKPLPAKPIFPGGDMQWLTYPIERRREFNRAAYEVLGTQDVEMFDRCDGLWKSASLVSLHHQYRVEPPEPTVRYLVQHTNGTETVYRTKPYSSTDKIIRLVETPE